MKRWIKRTALGLTVALVLISGALAWVLGTQTGLHFTLNQLPRWVTGLEIGKVDGHWRALTLSDVRYAMPGVEVSVSEFHLSVNVGCLGRGQLCINALTAQDVAVKVNTHQLTMDEPAEAAPTAPLTDIRTPYPIALDLLRLTNVNVIVDDMTFTLAELRSGAHWRARQLTLQPTQFSQLLVALPKMAENASAPDTVPTAAEQTTGDMLNALFSEPLLTELPDILLPMDFQLQRLIAEDIRITGDNPFQIDRLTLQAETEQAHVHITSLAIDSPQVVAALTGEATLSGNWPVDLILDGTINDPDLNGENVRLRLNGDIAGRLAADLSLSGPLSAQLNAEAELASRELPLSLTLVSQQLRWPLIGQSDYQLNNVRLRLQGTATNYALSLRSAIQGAEIPPANLLLDGKGNLEQFTFSRLRLAALQGNADLTGVVNWQDALSWRAVLTLNGINTEKYWPDWPTVLDGKIATNGSLNGGRWQIELADVDLAGRVKDNPLIIKGAAKGNDSGQWVIPGVNVSLGPNTLAIQGDLARVWHLDAAIDAPQLTGMLPGLSGTINGKVQLRGNIKAPQLLADLRASGLGWQDFHLERLTLNSDITAQQQVGGTLSLTMSGFQQADITLNQLHLAAQGNEASHQLTLDINGEPVSGQLALTGRFDRNTTRWQGALSNVRLETDVGPWQTTKAIALDYRHSQQRLSVGDHCWTNPNAHVCVPKPIELGESGQADVALNRLDLAMFTPFLDQDMQLNGLISGNVDVNWKADGGLPQANLALNGNGVAISQQVDGNVLTLALTTLRLDANMNSNRAQLNWRMEVANNGSFDGNVQVNDPQGNRQLAGSARIANLSLSLLKPLLEENEAAEGMINADLRLGGTVQSPLITGPLTLDGLRLNMQDVPLVVRSGHVNVNFNGTHSALNGSLTADKGTLTLGGNADWRQIDAWRARLTVRGDRVRVAMPPTVWLDVSPDIVFEATPQLLSLNGSASVPWARITVEEVPESATGVSSDEVMLDRQLRPIEARKASTPIASNLTVHIGNDVFLNAFGLKATLQGDLKVVQDRRGLGLNGQVNIPSGEYRAYGQDLLIQKGLIQFAGPPDQPLLNLEAIRNPEVTEDDVKAGIRVTGLASEPRAEIFSDPAMSQQEALSYLLRGQGLDNTGGDSDMMTSMLIGIGIAQSGKLVGQIGEAFGVRNLSLDTQGVGDSSAVVVSGYVTPRLQVKYGVGIFDALATLTLRYRLMPRLYLEAVSGIDQALDMLYQFEF